MGNVSWYKQSRGNRNPLILVGYVPCIAYYECVKVEELPSGRFAIRYADETRAIRYVTGLPRAKAFAEEWLLATVAEKILKSNALQDASF